MAERGLVREDGETEEPDRAVDLGDVGDCSAPGCGEAGFVGGAEEVGEVGFDGGHCAGGRDEVGGVTDGMSEAEWAVE